MAYSITLNGQCAKHHCVIDESRRVIFSSTTGLVFDFNLENGWTIDASDHCTFVLGSDFIIKARNFCNFISENNCTFKTGSRCSFNVKSHCTFKVGDYCTIKAPCNCTFKVGEFCTFTRSDIFGFYKLPAHVTCKTPEFGIRGLQLDTKEYVSEKMNTEEGLIFLLKTGEFFDPWQDDLGEDFRYVST